MTECFTPDQFAQLISHLSEIGMALGIMTGLAIPTCIYYVFIAKGK